MNPVTAYLLYAPQDQPIRNALVEHFSKLRRDGVLDLWDETQATAGEDLEVAKKHHLETADIILLLISSDFLASDDLDQQVNVALSRQRSNQARVVPVIARDCLWKTGALASLMPSPKGGNAINSRHFKDEDEAMNQVTNEVFTLAKMLRGEPVRPVGSGNQHVPSEPPTATKDAAPINKMTIFGIAALVVLALSWGMVKYIGSSPSDGAKPSGSEQSGGSTISDTGEKITSGGELMRELKAGTVVNFHNGKTEITILSAKVEAAGNNDILLRLSIKIFYKGNINIAIDNNNFRLLVGEDPINHENSIIKVVDANSTFKTDLLFKVPSNTTLAKLKIEMGEEKTEIPMDLSGATSPECNQHTPYTVQLSSNKVSFKPSKMEILEAKVYSYNAEQDELRLSVKYTYTGRYNDNLGNDNFRFKQPNDDQLAPMNFVNELVEPNAPVTVPVSYKFEKSIKKGQLILTKGEEKQVLDVSW